MEFRDLKANEIDLRVGAIKSTGYTLLLYKDARCDMNILDEQVGSENWQRDHKEIKGNLYCGVSIWDEKKNQWITKWDCGTESYSEKEKGEASDSFKRACFNWGIGRELYTSPFIWIDAKTEYKSGKYELSVEDKKILNNLVITEFVCENKIIKKLVISDKRTSKDYYIFVAEKKITKEQQELLKGFKINLQEVADYLKVGAINEIPYAYAQAIIEKHQKEGK